MTDSPGSRTPPLRRTQRRDSRSWRGRFALVTLAALAALPIVGGGARGAVVPQAGLERAIAAQRELAIERPGDATVREDLGSLLSLSGDLAGAEAEFREAIALAPTSASGHFKLGSVLEKLGKEKKALAEYREAIELDPKHAWAHYEAGTIWAAWGLDRLAKRAYARALALDSSLADPQVNPHILENRHATTAIILAYRDRPESAAPHTFHEPARIAGLILEQPETGDRLANDGDATPAGEEQGGGYAQAVGGERGAEAAAPDRGEDEAKKTLTSRDLDPSNESGQVVGGTAPGTVGGSRGRSSTESAAERAKAREAARQAARPSRTTPGGVVYPQNPGYAPQPARPAQPGGGFTPGPDSSGRIEVRLDERAG